MSHPPLVHTLVLPLGDPRAADPAVVGPKAAHLSSLAQSHTVPPGFCVTADAYRLAERAGGMPDELRSEIAAAYETLVSADVDDRGAPPPVAVRSSAVDEDGPAASFAGQHETVLNVVGSESVLAAIGHAWASLRSEAALAYRRSHRLAVDDLALAVLVQRLVVADASGVAFSVDPVAERRDRVVVNASWGLGESMVGGTVTPDTWTLDKGSLDPLEERLSEKARMTITADGGTREVAVPRFLRSRPSLGARQVAEVAALARSLEERQGWPVDIEFAYAGGRLHLLQCRPVTALTAAPEEAGALHETGGGELPPPWLEPEDATRFWKRDRLHFPGQFTELDFEVMRIAGERGVNHGATHYGLAFRTVARRFWNRYYTSDRAVEIPEAELGAARERSRAALEPVLADLEGAWVTRWLPEIREHLDFWSAFDLQGAASAELIEHLDESMRRAERIWELHFEIVIPMFRARRDFTDLYDELFEPDSKLRAFALLQGLDNLTIGAALGVWRLRSLVTASPSVEETIRSTPAREVLGALERLPEARALLDALAAYLDEFGRRGPYLGVSAPTFLEDPTPVVKMLKDAVERPERDMEASHAAAALERERLIAEARTALRTYPEPVRSEFETRLRSSHAAARLDEDHNFLIDFASSAALRFVFLEFGRRFAEAGALERRDDVFHLTSAEIRETAARLGSLDRRPLVRERAEELRRFADVEVPETLGTPPDPSALAGNDFAGVPPPPSSEPDVLPGTPGSAGRARGRARVIRSLDDSDRLLPGEVLVAPTTSPPWTPLFATAAALVTDTGGVLSHTAVVAREYRLPAVVGAVHATATLRDGMLLEVDGDRGTVRIIEEA